MLLEGLLSAQSRSVSNTTLDTANNKTCSYSQHGGSELPPDILTCWAACMSAPKAEIALALVPQHCDISNCCVRIPDFQKPDLMAVGAHSNVEMPLHIAACK